MLAAGRLASVLSLHVTVRLVGEAGSTVGASGVSGGSSSSPTVTTMVCLELFSRSFWPLTAITTSTYSLLPALFDGVVLSLSSGASWFGAVLKLKVPVASMANFSLSTPPTMA